MRPIFVLVLCSACGSTPSSGVDASIPTDAPSAVDSPVQIDAGPTGPVVRVHLRATTAPATHDPASSGQQPRGWVSGVRSLQLLRNMSDPDPLVVFDHGDGFVEASYDDGADTVVGSAPLAGLPMETFQVGRVVHTHVRFTVDSTLHSPAGATPGEFEDLFVLSDRTTLDGMTYMHGHYRFVFRAGTMEFPTMGEGYAAPMPSIGGFTIRMEAGETAYYFAAPIQLDPRSPTDLDLVFEVNVHEGFRWMDQDQPDYQTGVFDSTWTGTEPVVQLGANRYDFFLE